MSRKQIIRKIFINNENKVIECQIFVDKSQVETIIQYASRGTEKDSKLVRLGKKLITEKDELKLSQTVRDLTEYHPEIAYDRAIKNLLMNSIAMGSYGLDSALLSEEEMNDAVFLRRLRIFLTSIAKKSEEDIELSDSFKRETTRHIAEENQLEEDSLTSEITDSYVNKDEKKQFQLSMARQIPYTKK